MGRPANPWRAAEAWVRNCRVDGLHVHDPTPKAAIAELEDIPAQPCGCHCCNRSLRGSHRDLRATVCLCRSGPRATTAAVVAVTRHPTAEWLAQQIVEAFPWNVAPAYLVRDNDGAYGQAFRRRIRTMGIRYRPTSPRSPWQNAYAERLIGTLRRDCLDHVLIFGVKHLRQILTSYSSYYNQTRTHLSLDKDAPLRRAVQRCGTIVATPILSGLHHQYARI